MQTLLYNESLNRSYLLHLFQQSNIGMQNPLPSVLPSLSTLMHYLNRSPQILSSVDDNQFSKLQTKYRHLILKYQNDYQALSKLKLIQQAIPDMILNHKDVKAEMEEIHSIRERMRMCEENSRVLEEGLLDVDLELCELREEALEKKKKLLMDKRMYVNLRHLIEEGRGKTRVSPQPKITFEKARSFYSTSMDFKPKESRVRELDILESFERGLKEIQKKHFGSVRKNIGLVLRNIKINRNIQDVKLKIAFKPKQSPKPSTAKTSLKEIILNRNSLPVSSNLFNLPNFDEGEFCLTVPSHLQSSDSLSLYSTICEDKFKLCVFNRLLNQLLLFPPRQD